MSLVFILFHYIYSVFFCAAVLYCGKLTAKKDRRDLPGREGPTRTAEKILSIFLARIHNTNKMRKSLGTATRFRCAVYYAANAAE